jgi:HTH-type transcriptional regulator, global nitrogen regulator NrpRI
MTEQITQEEVERKVIAILQVLRDSDEPVGSNLIARKLKNSGIDINERTIRSHLQILDERGLTKLASRHQGRLITQSGLCELGNALVITKIQMSIYQSSFELGKCTGEVPVNISLFPAHNFKKCLEIMKSNCNARICASNLVAIALEGEKLGELKIPAGKIGLATLSNVMVSAVLIKAGIPLNFRFGGLLQVRKNDCVRFLDLIEYTGSSINPYEVFIASKMTAVSGITMNGNGKILAGFNELPALARPKVETIIKELELLGINGIVKLGKVSEPLCETPVNTGEFGMVITDGLNLVATVAETGLEVENHAIGSTIDFTRMRPLSNF